MKDTIYRQAAIEVADAVWSVTGDKNVAKVWDQLKDLPSAEPERKKPDHGYMWICPECGLEVHSDFVRCVRCGWERTSADLTCDGCATPKTICGICMRNYPNITDHYCTGEAWTEGKG